MRPSGGDHVPVTGEPVRGGQLFPWCPSVEVTEKELARLRAGQGIAPRESSPPSWQLPEGFPDPDAPLRALLGGFIVAMLRERDGALVAAPVLRGPL